MATTTVTRYSTQKFEAAYKRFFNEPTTLTDEDLAQLTAVDAEFAARARAAQAGYVEPAVPQDRKPVPHAVFMDFLRNGYRPILATYKHRIKLLEERIVALETRPANQPGVHYGGVHDVAKRYPPGCLVTRSGGLWLALEESEAEIPGLSPKWRLVVKGGTR